MWHVEDGLEAVEAACGACLGGWSAEVCPEGERIPLGWQADGKMRAAGAGWSLEIAICGGDRLVIAGRLTNLNDGPRRIEKVVLWAGRVELGAGPGRWAFFKNGFQSWSETRAFQAGETEQTSWLTPMNVLQSNPRNPPKGQAGAFTGEMFGLLGNLEQGVYLLAGQGDRRAQFVYVNVWLPDPLKMSSRGARGSGRATRRPPSENARSQLEAASAKRLAATCTEVEAPFGALKQRATPGQSTGLATTHPSLELVFDFGGQELAAGEAVELDALWLSAGSSPNTLLEAYLSATARPRALPERSPHGWCSWYYYYKKISALDLHENLSEIANRRPDWQVFVVDDGYTTQIGDWLEVNAKFPQGMAAVSAECRQNGLRPGLWLAPFVARSNSRLFHEHPEWVLRDGQGGAILAGWNPNWGLEGRFYGLDTTHPEFQAYLRTVIRTAVEAWGFDYLKLDFVYGACLPGRAYDSRLSAAQRLELGYRIIRETAGEEAFLLGCGSPFGPALGWVDGMRIGPDVAPYWDDFVRVKLTRDPHALSTRAAVRSILARSAFHRRWWLNDPDCLMLRETDTRLSAAERFTLAAAAAVTGGLMFFSDRLRLLPDPVWEQMRAIQAVARECDPYPAQVLGFMEAEFPRAVWNPAGYLAVFNFGDQPGAVEVCVQDVLAEGSTLQDVWSEVRLQVTGGRLVADALPAHGAVLLRLLRGA